jgi:hypothetical protein
MLTTTPWGMIATNSYSTEEEAWSGRANVAEWGWFLTRTCDNSLGPMSGTWKYGYHWNVTVK